MSPARRTGLAARLAGLDAEHAGSAAVEESYRVVRANLLVSLSAFEHPRVVITSAKPGEGKTEVCAHLAVSFARAGQRVVLVDLDLRHPDAHRVLGGHNRFGVSDLLLGHRRLDETLQFLPLPPVGDQAAQGLYFLATGPAVANPTELLGADRASALLDELGEQADIVLIDAPPVLPVADMLVLGRVVTGAVLVVEAHRTSITEVTKARNALTRNQTRIFGMVLNKQRRRDTGYGDIYGYGPSLGASVRPDAPVNGKPVAPAG